MLGLRLLGSASVLALVGASGLIAPGSASAQGAASLAGRWQAEPMTVRWVIGEWGERCGPRPSGGGDAGGGVTIEERGTELVIVGAQGSYSTDQCWDRNPELVRQGHTAGQRSWKTTCRTPANDSRQQILQTSVTATEDVISFQESGQYQFSIEGQTCAASSGRWRTYRRLAAGEEPVAPPPAREIPLEQPRRPAAPNPCSTPGLPARIEVRPARKLMRAGEEFQFRASVADNRGCPLRTPVTWALVPPDATARLSDGKLAVAEGARDAELKVVATAANQSVSVTVDVVSSERYAALLASGEFDADGASAESMTATITSGSVGAQQGAPDTESPERKWTFVGLVSAIALVFAGLGTWLLQRANRKAARSKPPEPTSASDAGTVVFADAMPRPKPPVADATRLEPVAPPPSAPKPRTVCPVCGTLYEDADLGACPKDGARLLPVNA